MTDDSIFGVQPDDWAELSSQLGNETDRGAALVGAAFLENLLGNLLEAFLLDSPKHTKQLLKGPLGPLGGFYSRTVAAYSLGLISDQELHDLTIIGEVRNAFAHQSKPLSFSSTQVKSKLAELQTPHLVPIDILDTSTLKPRQLFVNAASMISTFLFRRSKAIKDRRESAPRFYVQPMEGPD